VAAHARRRTNRLIEVIEIFEMQFQSDPLFRYCLNVVDLGRLVELVGEVAVDEIDRGP